MKNAQDVRFGLASWVTIVPSHLLILEKKEKLQNGSISLLKKPKPELIKFNCMSICMAFLGVARESHCSQRYFIIAASTTRHHRAGYPNGMPAQITSADDSFIFNRRRGSHALNAW